MCKVINNFLNINLFNSIKKNFDNNFSWYYNDYTASSEDKSNFIFTHILYDNSKINSSYFNSIVMPIIGRLNCSDILRAKLNLYTQREKHLKTSFHVDSQKKHQVALFSFNTNNGYTEFENGKKIKSLENTMILFDGNLKHRSVNQTNTKTRINLNINFIDVI